MPNDIDNDLADFGDNVSIELFNGIASALNNMIASTKPGETATIFVLAGFTPPLDPTIWAECVGGTVNDPLSPLDGQAIPDMRDRYLVGATTLGSVGGEGGANELNVQHDHEGLTVAVTNGGQLGDQSSGTYDYKTGHVHSVDSDLTADQNMEPVHFTIKHYFKIR